MSALGVERVAVERRRGLNRLDAPFRDEPADYPRRVKRLKRQVWILGGRMGRGTSVCSAAEASGTVDT